MRDTIKTIGFAFNAALNNRVAIVAAPVAAASPVRAAAFAAFAFACNLVRAALTVCITIDCDCNILTTF